MKLKLDSNSNVVVQDGKPVYVYDDGREVAFDATATVSKITALNGEAKAHREAKESAEAKLKSYDGIDDAEAARKALETVKNIKDGELLTAGKVEEIKTAAKRAAEEQVAAANKTHVEELTRTKSQLEKITTELYSEKIGGSFNRSKFISEKSAIPADLVQAKFGSAFKIEDGKIVAYDNSGTKIYSRSRPGELADFDEALETLIDHYPHKDQILKGSVAAGGGAANNGSGAGGKKQLKLAELNAMNPKDRAKHFSDGGTVI